MTAGGCALLGMLSTRSPAFSPSTPAQVLGRGLALLPRDQIVVATKVGRYSTFDFR